MKIAIMAATQQRNQVFYLYTTIAIGIDFRSGVKGPKGKYLDTIIIISVWYHDVENYSAADAIPPQRLMWHDSVGALNSLNFYFMC